MSDEGASEQLSAALWRQSVALAGALAESGVTRVGVSGAGLECEWTSPGTDLPGALAAAPLRARVTVPEILLVIERGGEGLRVIRAGSSRARAIARCVEDAG